MDVLEPEQVNQCIEYLAHFISSPRINFPYLLSQNMKTARIDFSKKIKGDCAELQSDPMLYLSWLALEHFENDFQENISKMFPLYANKWIEDCAKLKSYSPFKYG